MRKFMLFATLAAVAIIGGSVLVDAQPYGPGMMRDGGYGPGMMNGYGPGYHGQSNYGGQVNVELTPDNVKSYFERMIAEQGNPRLTVGNVKERDADIITADIVTKEGNVLVQRFAVDRHKGFYRPEEN